MSRDRGKPTVYLFDIDGTLITAGGAGRCAIVRSFKRTLGLEELSLGFSFAGMTDRLIIRSGLQELGLPVTDTSIDTILANYLEFLQGEVAQAERYFIHPGVREVLDMLHGKADVALGLGTGNVEAGARMKLKRGALNSYFDFGGFGCDAEARNELILCGAKRGAKRLGRELDACRTLVIGDTPRDIEAARAIGGECIAVATGGASYESLAACEPDWLFTDLTQDGAIEALLGT
jgi:phosphoglycolate phosphatase